MKKYENDLLNAIVDTYSKFENNTLEFGEKEDFLILMAKNGSKIRIKPENKGKFTASAKKAGQSVQEHAKSVLNNPNATPLQKKRANFARNAAKWNHSKK